MRDALLALTDRLRWLLRRHRGLAWCVVSAAAVGLLVIGGLAVVHAGRSVQQNSTVETASPPQVTQPPTVAESTLPMAPEAQSPAGASPTRPVRRLQGRDLATVWLTGFLTRSSRDDDRWVDAVRDLTTPELLQQLASAGPAYVGLEELDSWRVARIVPITAVHAPADTPSREVTTAAATVTDGKHQVEKPFQLYCYRNADGRWLVGAIEQPYASEG